jgi:hypothetical protein
LAYKKFSFWNTTIQGPWGETFIRSMQNLK